jgi:uncharacterized OB-fold protein
MSEAAGPFWEATRERRLVLQWCTACEAPVFYPRAVCPACLGSALEWRPASGHGVVYAVTVEHRPQNPTLAAQAPYAVALVELEEGVRLLTNLVGAAPETFAVDDAVAVTWEPLPDGRHLPLFAPR